MKDKKDDKNKVTVKKATSHSLQEMPFDELLKRVVKVPKPKSKTKKK